MRNGVELHIRAIETNDEKLREEMISEILKYNKEDLEATWAVLQWLKGFLISQAMPVSQNIGRVPNK